MNAEKSIYTEDEYRKMLKDAKTSLAELERQNQGLFDKYKAIQSSIDNLTYLIDAEQWMIGRFYRIEEPHAVYYINVNKVSAGGRYREYYGPTLRLVDPDYSRDVFDTDYRENGGYLAQRVFSDGFVEVSEEEFNEVKEIVENNDNEKVQHFLQRRK